MSEREEIKTTNTDATEYEVLHALEADPSSNTINRAAWFYALANQDMATAGRLFLRAAILEPGALHHRMEMARFLSRNGRIDRAVEWLQAALRLALKSRATKEELALVYLELANMYRQTNRNERFRRYLHLALQACPGYRPALRLLEPA